MSIRARLNRLHTAELNRCAARLEYCVRKSVATGMTLPSSTRRKLAQASRLPEQETIAMNAPCLPETFRRWMRDWADVLNAGLLAWPDRLPEPPDEPPGLRDALVREVSEDAAWTEPAIGLMVLMFARGARVYNRVGPRR